MSKSSRRPSRNLRHAVPPVTHEPTVPENWPDGHVSVRLTADDVLECLAVTIHGVQHYLHATTARELEKMVHGVLEEYNAKCERSGMPVV